MGRVFFRCRSFRFRLTGGYRSSIRAFTLLESLAVASLVAVLLGLSVSAVRGIVETSSRAAAVDQLMATLEGARMLAVSQGRASYVVFADASTGEDYRCRASAIFQDGEDLSLPPVLRGTWKVLPQGYSLNGNPSLSSVFTAAPEAVSPSFKRPGDGLFAELPYIKFGETGAVLHPADSQFASLVLFPGFTDSNGSPVVKHSVRSNLPIERINLSVFTGRAKYVLGDETK
jgi:type II secretory pathway pseudopilin PulG